MENNDQIVDELGRSSCSEDNHNILAGILRGRVPNLLPCPAASVSPRPHLAEVQLVASWGKLRLLGRNFQAALRSNGREDS